MRKGPGSVCDKWNISVAIYYLHEKEYYDTEEEKGIERLFNAKFGGKKNTLDLRTNL